MQYELFQVEAKPKRDSQEPPDDYPGVDWEPIFEHDHTGEAVGWTFCADERPGRA